MTPERLQTALTRALGAVCSQVVDLPDTVTLVRRNGDWTSNIALQTAGPQGRDARTLAAEVAERLRGDEGIVAVEVSGPGFLTITLEPTADVAAEIVASGDDYGTAAAIPTPAGVGSESAGSDPRLEEIRSAHARARRIERVASMAGVDRLGACASADGADGTERGEGTDGAAGTVPVAAGNPSARPGGDAEARALLTALTDFPRAAAQGDPVRLAAHVATVAEAFHRWADAHPVTPTVDEDITAVHAARLTLDRAAAVVLANGLRLLGSNAPERM